MPRFATTDDLPRDVLIWRGAWSSTTGYVRGDVVQHLGSAFVCAHANTNNNPATAQVRWQLLARGTPDAPKT